MSTRYATVPPAVSTAMESLAQELEDLFRHPQGASFEELERRLGRAVREVGRVAAGELLERQADEADTVEHEGVKYWRTLRASREYMTGFGPVQVERNLYRSVRNGPTICPMELRARIVEQFWTPHAAKVAAVAISDMTPLRASRFFEEFGAMTPSKSSLDRLPKQLSRRWEAQRERYEQEIRQQEQIPAKATSVAVSLDGIMVPMRATGKRDKRARTRAKGCPAKGPAGYQEVGCGAISFDDKEGSRLHTLRFGRMPEAKKTTLESMLRTELEEIRRRRPDLTVVAVADGAHPNWTFLDSLNPDKSVVDFYHAAEHLKRAVDITEGASSVATQATFSRLRHTLRHDARGVDKVMARLNGKRPRMKTPSARYRTGVRYFERHKHRMRYAELAARNLPIGSGVIEGTCKSLAADRLKRAGMRWDIPGGQAVLTVRALVHSERFDSGWNLIRETYARCAA